MVIIEERKFVKDGLQTETINGEHIGVYLCNMAQEPLSEGITHEAIGRFILDNTSDFARYPFPNSPSEIVYLCPERVKKLVRLAEVCLLIRTE